MASIVHFTTMQEIDSSETQESWFVYIPEAMIVMEVTSLEQEAKIDSIDHVILKGRTISPYETRWTTVNIEKDFLGVSDPNWFFGEPICVE